MSTTMESASFHKPDNGADYFRARRTEAMPKHTLFGSNIEKLDDDDKKLIRDVDIQEFQARTDRDRKLKQDRYKVKIPADLRKTLPEQSLEHTQQELTKQMIQADRAKRLMNLIEEKSRYFALGFESATENTFEAGKDHGALEANNNLRIAKDMNKIGLGGSSGFHYDKYRDKPPTHKYSYAGDPLRLGMDAPLPVQMSLHSKPVHRIERRRAPDHMPRECYMKHSTADVVQDDPCAVRLPPNIKHQFGTKVCNSLLSDAKKVEETLENQKKATTRQPSQSRRQVSSSALPEEDQDPGYKSLGDALRHDFFPGHTQNHKQSLAHSVYTDDVHKMHVPDPDKYRYQRDELSKWAEHNVLRDRMKKAWDLYLEDTLSKPKN